MQDNILIDIVTNDCYLIEGQDFVAHTVITKATDDFSQEELDYLDRVMEIHDYRYLPWI